MSVEENEQLRQRVEVLERRAAEDQRRIAEGQRRRAEDAEEAEKLRKLNEDLRARLEKRDADDMQGLSDVEVHQKLTVARDDAARIEAEIRRRKNTPGPIDPNKPHINSLLSLDLVTLVLREHLDLRTFVGVAPLVCRTWRDVSYACPNARALRPLAQQLHESGALDEGDEILVCNTAMIRGGGLWKTVCMELFRDRFDGITFLGPEHDGDEDFDGFSDDIDGDVIDMETVECVDYCRNLRRVDLFGQEDNVDLAMLPQCESVEELGLWRWEDLNDLGPIKMLPNLKVLNLNNCTSLTVVDLAHPALERLYLSCCESLSRVSLECKMLTKLNLSWCAGVTDVSGLVQCKKLTTFYLGGVTGVTDVSCLGQCKMLCNLFLNHGMGIDATSIDKLQELLPECVIHECFL